MRKSVVVGALLLGVGVLAVHGARESALEARQRATEARHVAAARDAYLAKQDALGAAYRLHRDELLASMRTALRDGHADVAAAAGLPYLPFADDEFKRVFTEAKGIADAQAAKRAAAAAAMARKQAAAHARKLAATQRREGVAIGMTKEQVLASSWGRPEHVNQTVTSAGTREQWVYANGAGYLYFDGDRLAGIQTGR